jgi:hypothetical protein
MAKKDTVFFKWMLFTLIVLLIYTYTGIPGRQTSVEPEAVCCKYSHVNGSIWYVILPDTNCVNPNPICEPGRMCALAMPSVSKFLDQQMIAQVLQGYMIMVYLNALLKMYSRSMVRLSTNLLQQLPHGGSHILW